MGMPTEPQRAETGYLGSPRRRLPLPASVRPFRIAWLYAVLVVGYHLLALLALLPWFFSWAGLWLAVAGVLVINGFGINVCYHRLLAHRGFTCAKWLEHAMAVLGACSLQDTPARWVAVHRRHHQLADEPSDPHSPQAGFFWGHMGWLLVENDELNRLGIYERYAKDILAERFYKTLDRNFLTVLIASWLVFFAGGCVADLLLGAGIGPALRFGCSLLVWGVFLRTVVAWHITWSVNSVTHLWGYRNYETDERSRNNWVVGILAGGEGWHNNHHADSRSARHGHRWWELDTTYLAIRLLALMGLAQDVVMPNPRLRERYVDGRLTTRGQPQTFGD